MPILSDNEGAPSPVRNHRRDRWASVRYGIRRRSDIAGAKVEKRAQSQKTSKSPKLLPFVTKKLKSSPVPRHLQRQEKTSSAKSTPVRPPLQSTHHVFMANQKSVKHRLGPRPAMAHGVLKSWTCLKQETQTEKFNTNKFPIGRH